MEKWKMLQYKGEFDYLWATLYNYDWTNHRDLYLTDCEEDLKQLSEVFSMRQGILRTEFM